MTSERGVHELQVPESVLDSILIDGLRSIIETNHEELHEAREVLRISVESDRSRFGDFLIDYSQKVPVGNYYRISILEGRPRTSRTLRVSGDIPVPSPSEIYAMSYGEIVRESDRVSICARESKSLAEASEGCRGMLDRARDRKMGKLR